MNEKKEHIVKHKLIIFILDFYNIIYFSLYTASKNKYIYNNYIV
jgi:hypothetical protein